MSDTVECPYCSHENDMSDGLTDLPSSNTFDHECEKCEQEFEVYVEFEPSYSGSKIVYIKCEKCGEETRDIYTKGRIVPYPKHLEEINVCRPCFHKAMKEEYERS